MTAPAERHAPRRRLARRAVGARTLRRVAGVVEQLAALRDDGGDGTLALGGTATLHVSDLERVWFPRCRLTKGDVMAYYAFISPLLLPALADRPLMLKRFPHGVSGASTYQQRAPEPVPDGVRVERIEDEGLTPHPRLVGGSLATLLYGVEIGAISVDPWHGRVPNVALADYAVIDLDPGPRAAFQAVVHVARMVRDELRHLGLHGIAKTSGASGLHVVVPLVPGTRADTARLVAELVATRVVERHPRETTLTRWVQSRPANAVYVDYLQNIRGKTIASVYAARATPFATVSAPLRWSELTDALDPRAFTIETMAARLRDVGDLWAPAMRRVNDPRRLLGDA